MKLKVGDKAIVDRELFAHNFKIGSTVEIVNVVEKTEDYRCEGIDAKTGTKMTYILTDAELTKINN